MPEIFIRWVFTNHILNNLIINNHYNTWTKYISNFSQIHTCHTSLHPLTRLPYLKIQVEHGQIWLKFRINIVSMVWYGMAWGFSGLLSIRQQINFYIRVCVTIEFSSRGVQTMFLAYIGGFFVILSENENESTSHKNF